MMAKQNLREERILELKEEEEAMRQGAEEKITQGFILAFYHLISL